MLEKFRNRKAPPADFNGEAALEEPENLYIEAGGGRYSCHSFDSKNGQWTLAYGLRPDDQSSTLFRLKDGEIKFSAAVNRPADGSIANDGTMAVTHRGDGNARVDGFRIIVDDETTTDQTLNAGISKISVHPDGSAVSVSTRHPDASVYTYDSRSGQEMWSYTLRGETPKLLGFHGKENLLLVARDLREEPYIALDADGNIAWGSNRYRMKRSLLERVRAFLASLKNYRL